MKVYLVDTTRRWKERSQIGKIKNKRDNKNRWGGECTFLLMKFREKNVIVEKKCEGKQKRNKEKTKGVRENTQVTDRGRERERGKEGAGLQIKSTASSHPVSPTRLPSSSSPPTAPPPNPLLPCPSLLVHLHGNQTGCLIHELNIFPVAG